jgi:hypothetical protein
LSQKTEDASNEARLTSLIWRTIRLRVLLLLLTLLAIFVIASTLQTGEQKASKVDADYKQSVIDLYKKYGRDPPAFQGVTGEMLSELVQRIMEMA